MATFEKQSAAFKAAVEQGKLVVNQIAFKDGSENVSFRLMQQVDGNTDNVVSILLGSDKSRVTYIANIAKKVYDKLGVDFTGITPIKLGDYTTYDFSVTDKVIDFNSFRQAMGIKGDKLFAIKQVNTFVPNTYTKSTNHRVVSGTNMCYVGKDGLKRPIFRHTDLVIVDANQTVDHKIILSTQGESMTNDEVALYVKGFTNRQGNDPEDIKFTDSVLQGQTKEESELDAARKQLLSGLIS